MSLLGWIAISVGFLVAYCALASLVALFCSANTLSEKRDQQAIDAEVKEFRDELDQP